MTFQSLFEMFRLRSQQWIGPEALATIQQRKLRALIRHAYKEVPYYRQLLDSNRIRPEDIRTLRDLAHLPVTTKSLFQSLPIEALTAGGVDIRRCVQSRTSGTLGIPLSVLYRTADSQYLNLVWARAKLANGQRLTDRVISIKESAYVPSPRRWYETLGIWNTTYVLNSLAPERQLDLIERVNPQVISGYPSSLKLLAHAMGARRERRIHPRRVFTMAELLDPSSRRMISSAFGAPLFDYYGAHELGLIAWECGKRAGYHINSDSVIVEFLWDDQPVPPGRQGKLVCTALQSFAMPFIRYEIGDVGIRSDAPCPCGRGLPLMKILEGRFVDFIALKDGTRVSPYELTCSIEDVPGIAQYQIIQESVDRLVVRLVQGGASSTDTSAKIRQNIHALLGNGVGVDIVIVEDLPKEQQKHHVVLSKVTAGRR